MPNERTTVRGAAGPERFHPRVLCSVTIHYVPGADPPPPERIEQAQSQKAQDRAETPRRDRAWALIAGRYIVRFIDASASLCRVTRVNFEAARPNA